MTEEEIVRRAGEAIKRFDALRIVGVGWSGDSRLGFQFNPESGLAGAASGGPPPPPQPTGACCLNGSCVVTTHALCTAEGGTYQGDGTNCSPNPCGCCDTLTITLSFSGIGFCGCVNLGDGSSESVTDNTDCGNVINTSFVLNNTLPGTWFTSFTTCPLSPLLNTFYPSTTDCTGTAGADYRFQIGATCTGGVWTVAVVDNRAGTYIFYATGASTTLLNSTSCGGTISGFQVSGVGGQVEITCGG